MAKAVELTVKIADLDEVKALMRQAAEEINRLRDGIAALATDLEDDGPHRLPIAPRKLAAVMRALLEPPATQDGAQS